MGGGAFIHAATAGTGMVDALGGPAWAVGLVPMAMLLGFSVMPIFTAHHLDRQDRFMPSLLVSGVFQRLPFLLAAIVLWCVDGGTAAWMAVLLAPLLSGVFGGLTVTGWQQLVGKTVPAQRRSSLFAWRYVVSSVIGLGAGYAVSAIMTALPGTRGYAVLHLIAFLGAAVSYGLFACIREERHEPHPMPDDHGFWDNVRDLPGLIASDRQIQLLVATAVLMCGQFALAGFLAVHARAVLHESDGYVGILTSAQMVGAIIGNLFAAWAGDRFGGKVLLILARVLVLVAAVIAAFTASDHAFRFASACMGAALFVNQVGTATLNLELLPAARRSTLLAMLGLVQLPGMLVSAQLAAWIWHNEWSFAWIAGLTAGLMLAALATTWAIREPRIANRTNND